tara:strand:+ start:67 stop:876 length:810 start_codon:yes stop_codon:yes gene_type:complete
MPKKLSLEDVQKYFEENGCKLISKEYNTNKDPIEFICQCGHNRKSTLTRVKTLKQFLCFDCTPRLCVSKETFDQRRMHPQTFEKNKKLLERNFANTHKYRSDYLPENYNKQLTCWDCKQTKNIRNFPYRKQYADNKEKRCKECNRKNHVERRSNASQDQIINEMLKTSAASAKKRLLRNRIEAGVFDLKADDIKELIAKQNNKCVYTGYELEWSHNNNYKASIDRIDSSKGYTKDNIQLVCFIVNQAKSDLSDDVFIDMCQKISSIKIN